MFKKSILSSSVALALVVPSFAMAEVEATIVLTNESAAYLDDTQLIGEARTSIDNTRYHDQGDLMKFENTARVFLNGDIGEASTWHAELSLVYDSEAVDDGLGEDWNWKGHQNYSQQDYLRELYVDTSTSGWDLRIGKQQQVWGTADGIKLLDIINPTDWREWAQNDMERSRIPVWMVSAEKNLDGGGNMQVIVSQAESSKIAGLSSIYDGETRSASFVNPFTSGPSVSTANTPGVDTGHAFIMKGVDTISGGVNGFLNIGAAFGPVTTLFGTNFGIGGLPPSFIDPAGNPNAEFTRVTDFAGLAGGTTPCAAPAFAAAVTGAGLPDPSGYDGAQCLKLFTEFANGYNTNLIDVDLTATPGGATGWDTTNPNSMWEYMPNATFATFNAFVGMTTKYIRDYEDDVDGNFGMRFRDSLDNGLNWGMNYLYALDPNPVVNIHWADPNTGQKLNVNEHVTVAGTSVYQLKNPVTGQVYGNNGATGLGSVTYVNANYVDGVGPDDVTGANSGGPAELRFVETLERVHNLGGSFDYAMNVGDIPLVLRGEALYQKDVYQPVIDLDELAKGNLTAALTTQESDFFKYVIGADITVMTNLLISGQFIQAINLDFVDGTRRYTADPSVMHLSNGLKKGYETKEFVSLFLSKPIGEDQLGRWNNIIMWEEGDGWWNRLNADYSITDQFIVTGEWNHYWGDENTTFGQFENSSNVQVGFKYIFENY